MACRVCGVLDKQANQADELHSQDILVETVRCFFYSSFQKESLKWKCVASRELPINMVFIGNGAI